MRPTRLMTRLATLRTATLESVDEYGNPRIAYIERTVRCELQHPTRDDDTTDAHTQLETFALFLPPNTPADGWSQVAVDGAVYELVGPPWHARHPRTRKVTHLEATIKATV